MGTAISDTPINSAPMVSVCMITYNHAPYIRQAIEGVLMQQTEFPFELLIGEDCSTDQTREICRHYLAQYPDKIHLLLPEKNLGSLDNFFATLDAATGKYIAFCEGDDYWIDPLKLQRQVDFLEANPDYGLVYTEVDFLFQKQQKIRHKVFATGFVRNHDNLESFLVDGGYKAPCTWLFRRELMTLIDRQSITTDATFVLMLEFMGHTKIKFQPESTSVYRNLNESASRSKNIRKSLQYAYGVLQTQKTYIQKYNLPEYAYDKVGRRAYKRIIPWALAVQNQTIINEARAFFSARKKTGKEKIRTLRLSAPTLFGWIYKMKYKLKGGLQ